MIVTVLEARVDESRWADLKAGYERITSPLPAQIAATELLQAVADRSLWRVQTTWKSRRALQEYQQSVDAPEGLLLFGAVGAEPTLTIFGVVRLVEGREAANAAGATSTATEAVT